MFRPRFNLATGVALTAAVVALYSALWLILAHQARGQIDAYMAREREQGLNLAMADERTGGFPFRLEIQLDEVVAAGLPHMAEGHLTAPVVVAWARPWRLDDWHFALPQGARVEAPQHSVAIARLSGAVSSVLGPGATPGGERADVELTDVSVTSGERLTKVDAARLILHLPPTAPRIHEEPLFSVTVEAHHIALAAGLAPLGQQIDHLMLDATWRGPVPPGTLPNALAAWRDDGGTIELQGIDLGWGPLILAADGTLALDKALQPLGAFSARIMGYDAILDALIDTGAIKQNDAALVRVGLSMMAQRGADGTPQLKTPVSIQDDAVYLGPARLVKLMPIVW
jgi:hypothetical protein